MALIKCKECGKEISDTLNVCPNCGIEIKKANITNNNKNNHNLYGKIDILLFILLMIYSLIRLYYIITGIKDCILSLTTIKGILISTKNLLLIVSLLSFLWLTFLYFEKGKNNYKKLGFISLMIYCFTMVFNYLDFKFFSLLEILNNILISIIPIAILGIISLRIGEKNNGVNKM